MKSEAEVICGTQEAACFCQLEPGHDGPHECACGGSWTFDEYGFVPVRFPSWE